MTDEAIVELYWQRDEAALTHSQQAYGGLCAGIARRMLRCAPDAEEALNDTWLAAWHAMPDARPAKLGPFLGRITRNLCLKQLERAGAAKRAAGFGPVLDELVECIPGGESAEDEAAARELARRIEAFLRGQKPFARDVFLRRYWAAQPVGEIAAAYGVSENKVSVTLLRTRRRLLQQLEQEGML